MKEYIYAHKLGSKVNLSYPFDKVKAEVTGVRFEKGVVSYECTIADGFYIENISSRCLSSELEDNHGRLKALDNYSKEEFYIFFEDNKYLDNCVILATYAYLNNSDELEIRHKVGYKNQMMIMNDINPKYIFSKEDALIKIRDLKLKKV